MGVIKVIYSYSKMMTKLFEIAEHTSTLLFDRNYDMSNGHHKNQERIVILNTKKIKR